MVRNRKLVALVVAVLVCVVAAIGCKKPKRVTLTKEQREQIQVHVLSPETMPAFETRLDANLDGRIRLIAVKVSKSEVRPGDSFDVTYYWECLKPLRGEWKVFVHLENPGPPKAERQLLDHHPVGELYPIGQWNAGEVIEDVQHVRLRSGFPGGTANLWVGVFDEQAWREQGKDDRLRLVNTGDVPHDGDNRIRVAQIQILGGKGGQAARRFVRNYSVMKTDEAITVDGKLDESAWQSARRTQPLVQPDGAPLDSRIQARARLLWDDTHLYVAFTVQDDDLWNPKTQRDAELWEQDVVEIYLDPGSDGRDYVELQVSPTGAVFDAWFDSHRAPDWPDAARRFNIGWRSAVTTDGSVNARDDGVEDKGWTVEVAIPFAELPGLSGPPAEGDRWRLNLYRLDSKGAGTMANQGAWAPVGGDFHNVIDAGTLAFRGPRPSPSIRPTTLPSLPHGAAPGPVRVPPSVLPTSPPATPSAVDPPEEAGPPAGGAAGEEEAPEGEAPGEPGAPAEEAAPAPAEEAPASRPVVAPTPAP